jgi:hypothetical protein
MINLMMGVMIIIFFDNGSTDYDNDDGGYNYDLYDNRSDKDLIMIRMMKK